MLMLLLKWYCARCLLRLTHYLNLDTLRSDIVKDQLRTRTSFGIYSPTQPNFDIFEVFTCLDRIVSFEEIPKVGSDFELVGVWVGLLVLAKLFDLGTSNLVVLLERIVRWNCDCVEMPVVR